MKRRAFTLIELLLVLAIIGAIIGLVFAVFGSSREETRQRVCASNLHQIGIAFALYIADYDGVDPVVGIPMKHYQLGLPGYAGSGYVFDTQYLKNKDVVKCPSFHGPGDSSKLGSTYEWPGFLTDEDAPELNLPQEVARRGPQYVLVDCDQHNTSLDFHHQPRWATKRVLVLRISQQVQNELVPVREGADKY